MKKLFWDDPYQVENETVVSAVCGNRVQVEETVAYAFSGGQESDSGTIGGSPIIKAEKDDSSFGIWYTLQENHGLHVGDAVVVRIDWKRRYALMRLHFLAELVLEWMYQLYDRPEKIGAHISEEKSRVDFYWSGSIAPVLPVLEEKIQALIEADLPIRSAFSDEALQRRFWEIEGFAKVPCGGTHIRRTSELGSFQLKRKNIGGGKERIEIRLVP